MVFKDCKVQKIVSFHEDFKEAVQDCKELRTPWPVLKNAHMTIVTLLFVL